MTVSTNEPYSSLYWSSSSTLINWGNRTLNPTTAQVNAGSFPITLPVSVKFGYPDGCYVTKTQNVTFNLYNNLNSSISIYPNPTKGLLKIDGLPDGKLTIEIVPISDQNRVETISMNSNDGVIELDIRHYTANSFIVRILNSKGDLIAVKRVIKE